MMSKACVYVYIVLASMDLHLKLKDNYAKLLLIQSTFGIL